MIGINSYETIKRLQNKNNVCKKKEFVQTN